MMIVMGVICVAVFLFIVEWVRVDVVAIIMMVALPLLGLITPAEAFVGFSSNAVISIIAVINIGAAALFLPAIERVSKTTKIPVSRILTPVGFSVIMRGV